MRSTLLEHAADGFFVVLRAPALCDRSLAEAPDDGQGSAELMGRVGRESPQLVERGLEARERIVDDRREPADFVRLILERSGAHADARP